VAANTNPGQANLQFWSNTIESKENIISMILNRFVCLEKIVADFKPE